MRTRQLASIATTTLFTLVGVLLTSCHRQAEDVAHNERKVLVSPGSVSEIIGRANTYSRESLGMRDPALTYVLVACFDQDARLDHKNASCPGTAMTTFAERTALRGELAFVALGADGMMGARTPFGSVISLDPPQCRAQELIGIARARGIVWKASTRTTVSFAPRKTPLPPAWTLTIDGQPALELTDSECRRAAGLP